MSGRSYLYYGEELGMKGSGEDPNKRLPMQWEKDQDASGMCKPAVGAEMQEMPYGSLGKQKKDAYSIYNYMKESIQLRNRFPLIARGETKALADLSTSKVMAIQKTVPETIPDGMSEKIKGEKALTIFVNTSGEKQTVKLTGELAKASLVGVLVTGKSKVEVKEGKLILPAYGTAILQ
jgi:glycosidase